MQRALSFIALGLALCASGCEQADPSTTGYWIDKLKTEERVSAIQKLAEMKDLSAVKPLMEAYKEGRSKYQIIAALTQLGDKTAAPTMLEALQDTSAAKAGQLAGSTLLEWEAKEHSAIYINVASNKSAPNELRYGALKLLAKYPSKAAEQPLLSSLSGDPDLQPIAFNGLAAEALGTLQSAAAVPGLINCLWLDDHLHRNEVPKCRLALNRVGPKAAVPKLVETIERKNRAVEKRARKLKFNKGGLIEAKTAELLGDMPSPAAVDALIKALLNFEEMPVSVQNDPNKARAFVMSGVQRVISVANALAVIGDARAVEPLLQVAGGAELALEHKLSATQQLAFLGQTSAIAGTKKTPGLLKLLDKKISRYDPVSQGFRVQIALAIANLVSADDTKTISKFKKSIEGYTGDMAKWTEETKVEIAKRTAEKKSTTSLSRDLKAYAQWTKDYGEALTKLEALNECKNDPVCWGKKLAGKEISARLAAAYRLAQMKDTRDTALKQLVAQIGDTDLAVRNVVLFGLDRLGDESIIPQLKKAREADAIKAKKDKRYRGAVYTLDLMIAKLGHKKKK